MAESAGLSIELRRELQGRQLVKLLTADPLNGGGPAEASRFLSSLRDSDDALPVAMGAMQLLPNLRSKQLLVSGFFDLYDMSTCFCFLSLRNTVKIWRKIVFILSSILKKYRKKYCSEFYNVLFLTWPYVFVVHEGPFFLEEKRW